MSIATLHRIDLTIHGWELPSVRKDALRAHTRERITRAFAKVWEGVKVTVRYDEEPSRTVAVGVTVRGGKGEERDWLTQETGYRAGRLASWILSQYVRADSLERAKYGEYTFADPRKRRHIRRSLNLETV